MTEIPDVCIYMRRVGAMHARNMASIAERTQMSFNLIYVFEEGTNHENINNALRRSKSRWCCLVDDDVEVLTDYWLRTLMQRMEQYSDIGVMTIQEVKTEEKRLEYLASPQCQPRIFIRTWCQGCVHLYDRDRLDNGQIPEAPLDSPPPTGMGDVDMSWQIRAQGLKCGACAEVVVFHPFKPREDPDYVRKYREIPATEVEYRWKELCKYMLNKWGHDYFYSNIVLRTLEERP